MKLNKIKKQQLKNLTANSLSNKQTAEIAGGAYTNPDLTTNPVITCYSCLTDCPMYRCPSFYGC